MGATTQCHDKCVLIKKERSSVSCKDASACLGEWSSGVVHASSTITSHMEAFSPLNRLEHDSHLVVVTHKAPHEVQRQCLLHVPLKVMKGVLSHVRKVKACVPVAQYEVRLFLRALHRQQNHATKQHANQESSSSCQKFAQTTNESARPCLTSFKMQTSS